jgi:Flp pilus assembly protein TadD
MKQFLFGLIFISISGFATFGQGKDFDTSFERGVTLANNGNFAEAFVEFRNAERLINGSKLTKKRLAQLHFNIGVCHFRMNKNAEAIGRFETAVQVFPKYERAHYALGMAASELRDWQKAERAFHDALKVNKANGEAWFDLGFVYLAKGEMLKARSAFETSIELKTIDAATAHNNVGVIRALSGDRDFAERAFENAVRVSNGAYKIAAVNLAVIRKHRTETLVAANFTLGKQRNFFGE